MSASDDLDLRTAWVAVAIWAGAWCGVTAGWAWWVAGAVVAVCGVTAWRLHSRAFVAAGVAAFLACVIGALSWWAGVSSPLTGLAQDRAIVSVRAVVTGDPVTWAARGFLPEQVVAPVRVEYVEARGKGATLRQEASLQLMDDATQLAVGQTVAVPARAAWVTTSLIPTVRLTATAPVEVVAQPGAFTRLLNSARDGLRDAMKWSPPDQAGLVPGLVVGDTSQAVPDLVEAFRVTSLSHLTAVSGTNLTLMVVFLVAVARALGARGWWLRGVTAAGVVLFVALCRGEPSVLRAAAMGLVGLAATGLSAGGRGMRQWGVAVGLVCLLQPAMSHSWGFAMSAAATAGILWWSPKWSKALRHWTPVWAADMIAVPLAAQLATQPLVTAINGQVSLVGIFANMCAAPFVGPVTVLGLVACLLSGISPPAAAVVGWLAGWCSQPIIAVANGLSSLPGATLAWGVSQWGATAVALVALTGCCWLIARALPVVLKRWTTSVLGFAVLGAATVVTVPTPGWPGLWTAVFCDVGQGDASVLRVADGVGVLVDAGPDPPALWRCLDALGINRLALVVFSHEHADHIDGAKGLTRHVRVDMVLVRSGLSPPKTAEVDVLIGDRTVPVKSAWTGQTIQVGALVWHTVYSGQLVLAPTTAGEGEDPQENDASIIALAELDGVRILFTGDAEPEAQLAALHTGADMRVDVLKVAHHGSARQDAGFLAATHASVAVISVGLNNGYGHPAASTISALRADGMAVYRTDQCGGVSLVRSGTGLSVRTQHRYDG